MTIRLPRILSFDLNNIPKDFEQIIAQSFRDFTRGTRSEYQYQDKLLYIDNCVRLLHGDKEPYQAVREMIHDSVDSTLDECGIMPKDSDFMDESFLEYCYEQGRKSARLYSEYVSKGSKDDERIMLLLCRIIKTVINLEV